MVLLHNGEPLRCMNSLRQNKSDRVNDTLRLACSIVSFRSTHIESYRSNIFDSFNLVLGFAKEQREAADDGMNLHYESYNAPMIERSLRSIEWENLCRHHDDFSLKVSNRKKRTREMKWTTTPLEEVTSALANPTIIPPCCAVPLLRTLTKVFIQAPRARSRNNQCSRWSPAQTTLLLHIEQIFNIRPAEGLTSLQSLLADLNQASPNEWNRLLSLAHHLSTQSQRVRLALASFVIDFLRCIDDRDIVLITTSFPGAIESKNPDTCSCSRHHIGREMKVAKRGVRHATLANLHDQDLTLSDGEKVHRGADGPEKLHTFSFQEVLKDRLANERRSLERCNCQRTPNNRLSVLSPEWTTVRARAYKKFLNVVENYHGMTPTSRLSAHSATYRSVVPVLRRFPIGVLLAAASANKISPSIRVCMLIYLDHAGKKDAPQPLIILKAFWARYLNSKDHVWLRIYSELLVECPIFYQRSTCWTLFVPLLKRLICEEKDEDNSKSRKWLFRCVSFVLSRRHRLFLEKTDKVKFEYQTTLTQLKTRFSELRYWVDDSTDSTERERILYALEKAGIIGLVDLVDGDVKFNVSNESNGAKTMVASQARYEARSPSLALKSWPFHSPFDLRSSCLRAGTEFGSFLSDPDFDTNIALEPEEEELPGSSVASLGPPMLEVLDCDIFRFIFSFFGYKRLVRMREVCSLWRRIVDESNALWYGVYRTRFGLLPEDPRAVWGQHYENWKSRFFSRWLVEQSIAFKRNKSTGWKHRICKFVGCHQVLTSPKAEQRHYESHARKRREGEEKLLSVGLDIRSVPKSQKK